MLRSAGPADWVPCADERRALDVVLSKMMMGPAWALERDEVRQQMLIRLWETAADRAASSRSPFSGAYRCCLQAGIDAIRSELGRGERREWSQMATDDSGARWCEAEIDRHTPEDELSSRETAAAFLARLSPRQRAALCAYMETGTQALAAAELGVTTDRVHAALAGIRAKARDLLRPEVVNGFTRTSAPGWKKVRSYRQR